MAAIAALPGDQIDTSDIPEPLTERPESRRSEPLLSPFETIRFSLRLDADVVAWLKTPGKGYQTRANHILRERMLADIRKVRA